MLIKSCVAEYKVLLLFYIGFLKMSRREAIAINGLIF